MATEAEIIASNVLASAIEYKRLYDTTKNNEYKVKEQRLRKIAENIKLIVGSSSSSAVSSFNGRTGAVTLTATDVNGALGYTAGDMLKSVYDYDNDGVVDSAERTEIIVRNSTGSTLTKGTVVYLSGATGNRPNALRAQANSEATSSKTFGFVVSDIPNNSDGYVACAGTLHDLDTSAFADGASLWLSPTVAGGWTTTVPSEPNHSVFLGYVARSHPTQGRVVILIQNGYELEELHNVAISSIANNDLLVYESATSLWKNKQLATVLGYTPISLTSLSATAPLLYNNTTGVFSIQQASGSQNGYLSSTDWTTFNSKQNALSLTTTGSSGAATLVSSTLNIPNYTLSGLGGQPLSTNLTSLASLTYASTSFVKMTAAGTFSLDTNTYYLASNPNGYTNNTGTVTSVSMTVPTGLTVSGSPITSSGTIAITLTTGYSIPTTASQTNWDTAYSNRITSLTTTGSSGAATLVSNVLNIPNYTLSGLGGQPLSSNLTSLAALTYTSASFVKMTAAGTFSLDTNSYYLASNPNGYTNNTGTVTSVSMTVPTGLSISGSPITSSGTLALTLTTGYSIPTTASQSNWDTAYSNRINTLTTLGNSGAATLLSNSLNIPNYSVNFTNNTSGNIMTGSGTTNTLNGQTELTYLSNTLSFGPNLDNNTTYTITTRNQMVISANTDATNDAFFTFLTLQSGAGTNISAVAIVGSSTNNYIAFRTLATERMRVFNTGNVTIQNGGTFTDAGFRLDVNGTTRLQNQLTVNGSITAATAIARGGYFNNTLVAAANNDILVAMDIAPTFTLGAFTGVNSVALRLSGGVLRVAQLAADPAVANSANGDIYYNTTTNKFRGRENGVWVNFV